MDADDSISLQPPKKIELGGNIKDLILQVDEAILDLNKLRPFSPEVSTRLRVAFLPDRITASLNMEGIVATRRQTLAIMDAMTLATNSSRSDQETLNALEADEFVFDMIERRVDLDQSMIREINSKVLNGLMEDAGSYRTGTVEITGAAFYPPPPSSIAAFMSQLCELYATADYIHPIIQAAWLHAQFTLIHPFKDGNGRTGRLLQDFSLLRRDFLPTGIPSSKRDDYYTALERADQGNWDELVEMIALLQLSTINKTDAIAREPEQRAKWINQLAQIATAKKTGALHKNYLLWRQRVSAIEQAIHQAADEIDKASDVVGVSSRSYEIVDFEKWKRICQYGYADRTWLFSLLFFAGGQPFYKIIGFLRRHNPVPEDTFGETRDLVSVYITGQDANDPTPPNFYNFHDPHIRLRELLYPGDDLVVYYEENPAEEFVIKYDLSVENVVQDLFEDIFYRKAGLAG